MSCSSATAADPAGSACAPESDSVALVVVCAWCGRPMGRGAVATHRIVTHGICRPCSDEVLFAASDLVTRR